MQCLRAPLSFPERVFATQNRSKAVYPWRAAFRALRAVLQGGEATGGKNAALRAVRSGAETDLGAYRDHDLYYLLIALLSNANVSLRRREVVLRWPFHGVR